MKMPLTHITSFRTNQHFDAPLSRHIALLLGVMSLAWPAWGELTFDENEGTVKDSTTQLAWDRCAYGLSGADCKGGSAVAATWYEALKIADEANKNGGYKKLTGWRLPNKNELESITRVRPSPVFDSSKFPETPGEPFWTSTSYVQSPSAAWYVDFFENFVTYQFKTNRFRVRLVRDLPTVPLCKITPNPTSINAGASLTLTASCSPEATSYTWTGGTCAGTTADTCTATPTATTNYAVTGINASGTGTAASVEVKVYPKDSPVCTLKADPSNLIAGASAILTATCTLAPSKYVWTGSTTCDENKNTCTVAPSAKTLYTVQGTNAKGSGAPDEALIDVFPQGSPTCTLTPNPVAIKSGESSTLTASCGDATSYVWSDSTCNKANNTCAVKPSITTKYTVQGTNAKGSGMPATATVRMPPVCTLDVDRKVVSSSNPESVKLTVGCTPSATSYAWTKTDLTTNSTSKVEPAWKPENGIVEQSAPNVPTRYTMVGTNEDGSSEKASTAVYVCGKGFKSFAVDYSGEEKKGGDANDSFSSSLGSDVFNGGKGTDTVVYNCNHNELFVVSKTKDGWTVSSFAEGADSIIDVERIQFADETLILDVTGVAGQAYRLYQAAFNRTPDAGGLGYWIGQMDKGAKLEQVAKEFIYSAEFFRLYGYSSTPGKPTNDEFKTLTQEQKDDFVTKTLTNAVFLTKLYDNVLHRKPDQGGYDWWLGELNAGRHTKTTALMGMSESGENVAGVLDAIMNGIVMGNPN